MQLRPLTHEQDYETVTAWLRDDRNHQWLDLGSQAAQLTPLAVKAMDQRKSNVLRLFADEENTPLGLVALGSVHAEFRTGMLWYVLGDRTREGRGLTSEAVGAFLGEVFEQGTVEAVHAWAVEANGASIRVLEKNGFRPIGRQRRCHYIDGQPHDRLLFDLIAEEHPAFDHQERLRYDHAGCAGG